MRGEGEEREMERQEVEKERALASATAPKPQLCCVLWARRRGGFGGRPPPPPSPVSDVSVRSWQRSERGDSEASTAGGGQAPMNLLMIRDVSFSFPIPFLSESGMMHNDA